MIAIGEKKAVICKGDFRPAQLYKGDKKIAGYTVEQFEGTGSATLANCYNDNLNDFVIYGNSIQDGTPTPDNPIEVQSVGELVTEGEYAGKYKVPVTVRGKNLFDRDSYPLTIGICIWGNSGKVSDPKYPQYAATRDYIPCDSLRGRDITINHTLGNSVGMAFYDIDKTVISSIGYNGAKSKTVTVPDTAFYYRFSVDVTYIDEIQIAYDNDCTYEPYIEPQTFNIYLDEPLRKIGDYADCVDFDKGVVVRNITETNLKRDGYIINSQHFAKRTNTSRTLLSNNDKKPNATKKSLFLCNRGQGQPDAYWSTDKVGICEMMNPSMAGFIFNLPIEEVSQQSDFDTWVENHDTTLVYLSKTPTEEPIELPKLPQFKGTTIYEIESDVSVRIEGKYKRTEI